MSNKKQQYKQLCAQEASIPLFSQDWWLDAAVGGHNWDVAVVENHDTIVASMPYLRNKRIGLRISTLPPLTYCLGPWLRASDAKHTTQLSRQKDAMGKLIEQLPDFDHFKQSWHHTQTNWLPFYWRGFDQTTYYTYLLALQTGETAMWEGLQENIRREVRKASGRSGLCVRDDLSVADFLPLHKLVYTRQNKSLPYSDQVVYKLDAACKARNQRKIFIAQDQQGVAHAGLYLAWDETSAYYLMGGGDPKLRNSGAMSLCMWEAIKFASTITPRFDFCGSMLESIEHFVRAFGGTQTPYLTVSKTPSRLASSLLFARSWARDR